MKILSLFALFLSFYSTHAQTLTEEMGAVSCAFEFSSNGNKLEVEKQQLIERARARKEVSTTANESYGLGLAYTEWHLEFILESEIGWRKKTDMETVDHRSKYCIQFLDSNHAVLLKQYLGLDNIIEWHGGTTEEPLHIYSLNLINTPFIILEDVTSIEIVKVN